MESVSWRRTKIDYLRVETKKWKVGKLQFPCRNFCSSGKPCLHVVLSWGWREKWGEPLGSNPPPFSRLLSWGNSLGFIISNHPPPSGYLQSCRWNLSWWSCGFSPQEKMRVGPGAERKQNLPDSPARHFCQDLQNVPGWQDLLGPESFQREISSGGFRKKNCAQILCWSAENTAGRLR